MKPAAPSRQAHRLYRVFSELVRGYQFRDREGSCGHGLSVSQCYALDTLADQGPMTMGELASSLCLELSTMTRLVDALVAAELVTRAQDADDRRVCRVRITRKGQSLVSRIRSELISEHETVLRRIPPESREAVIEALAQLLAAFQARQRRHAAGNRDGSGRRNRAEGERTLPPLAGAGPRGCGRENVRS
jgi:MarR family transcriptional regulator, 2-MHQ and catechol-resistance regulon repressor